MTSRTAVFGYPVAHSLSPLLHNEFYKNENIDAKMEAVEIKEVFDVAAIIRETPIALSAITIPHKETILTQLDEVDEKALRIGSVNTVINRDGILHGYNTDIDGIAASLKDEALKDKNVLVIGAGGAARPVAFYLQEQGAHIFYTNRTLDKARLLAKDFGGTAVSGVKLLNYQFEVIINTTPVGMSPNVSETPIPAENIRPGSTVFDIIYTPLETRLLNEAQARGAKTINGITMFVAQALAQERYWRGQQYNDKNYQELLIQNLNK